MRDDNDERQACTKFSDLNSLRLRDDNTRGGDYKTLADESDDDDYEKTERSGDGIVVTNEMWNVMGRRRALSLKFMVWVYALAWLRKVKRQLVAVGTTTWNEQLVSSRLHLDLNSDEKPVESRFAVGSRKFLNFEESKKSFPSNW
jgi:hypothetical protein